MTVLADESDIETPALLTTKLAKTAVCRDKLLMAFAASTDPESEGERIAESLRAATGGVGSGGCGSSAAGVPALFRNRNQSGDILWRPFRRRGNNDHELQANGAER